MPTVVNDTQATDDWEEALIAGGGGQGALVYGGPAALRVTLSREGLFLPVDEPLPAPDTGGWLDELRALCVDGAFQTAADRVVERAVADDGRYSRLRWIDPFIGAATLTFTPWVDIGGWTRGLDLATGVVTQGGSALRQRVFASRTHRVVVVELAGLVRGRLHLGPVRGAPPAPIALRHESTPDTLRLVARFPRRWSGSLSGYATEVRVIGAGVRALPGGHGVDLETDRVLLVVRTSLRPTAAPELPLADQSWLASVAADGFDALARSHIARHGELMGRCTLELPAAPDVVARFDAGRYAIISATGDRPPTLQGVWSGDFDPPWRSGYTMDGNLATALAALGPTGTPELLRPVCDLLDAHLDDFRENAWRLYRAPGFVVPPHLSSHGRHNHFGPRWCLTMWTAGAAWAARFGYDYWRFSGELRFLRERVWPFMTEALSFYVAVLQPDGAGLRLAPSYSPENSPRGPDGPQATVNATHEIAAIRDLLRSAQAAAAALGETEPPGWGETLDRLPPYRIGPDGALAEWSWPTLPDNHAHRHAPHLFGLWYEPDPQLLTEPLRTAAANTIRRRLAWWATAGDEMAFGLVSLGLAAAALGLAEEAHACLERLARYWRPSLVPTHNVAAIFNTDIAGGYPALVAAMLAAGADADIRLLPACPAAWQTGTVEGLMLRGGVRVVSLRWSPEAVTATLRCANPRRLTVTVRDGPPQDIDVGPEAIDVCLASSQTKPQPSAPRS